MANVLSDLDFLGVSRIKNLPAPGAANDPARKADLDALIEGLAWKDNARVATQSNVSLGSPGASIDGVALSPGDRVLVRNQTAQTENGIYTFNGAAAAMARTLDASAADELLNATVPVDEGTDAGTVWRQTAVSIVVGVTSIVFVTFGSSAPPASTTTPGLIELATQGEVDAGSSANTAVTPQTLANWSGGPRRYATDIGDGASTQYTVTHNLGSYDVSVTVYANSGNRGDVLVDVERTSTNAVRITFGAAPSTNAYRVVVQR